MAIVLYALYENASKILGIKPHNFMHFDNSESSFPEYTYPSLRDEHLKDGNQWLLGKTLDDGAEGLWRIHDDLYDFGEFIDSHPGGRDWLMFTKGTDITEAFEAHHISTIPEKMLCKYLARKAKKPRNSPFTFRADGFYRTLKGRVRNELGIVPKNLESKSKRIVEALALSVFLVSILVSRLDWMPAKVLLYILSGVLLTWTTIAAHNFLHQRDNWRMYLFNLGFMSYREWRKTHALSHHLYTNTLWDFEISQIEPLVQWMPRTTKSTFIRYGSMIYSFLLIPFTIEDIVSNRMYRFLFVDEYQKVEKTAVVPFVLPFFMMVFGNTSALMTIFDWMVIVHIGNFMFSLIGIFSAHHHPDVFHDGDTPNQDSDWGLHQLRAVMDRVEFTNSQFLVLTNFGDHVLHHLFPTLDHAYLPWLYPIIHKTSKEFNTELKMTTHMDMVVGQFKQLAKNKPT